MCKEAVEGGFVAWGLPPCALCLPVALCPLCATQPAWSCGCRVQAAWDENLGSTNSQSLQNVVKTCQHTEETSGSGSQQNAFLELLPIGKHSSILVVMTSQQPWIKIFSCLN